MTPPPVKPRRPRRRTVMWAAVGVAVLAVAGIATAATAAIPSAAAIDGVELREDEVRLGEERAEIDGAAPGDVDAAIGVLRDDMALFAVAAELGASDVGRPADILDLVDEVNRDRAETVASGGVVYGPVEYDDRAFYGTSLADIRQAALAALEDRGGVTDGDVRARFDADADQWEAAATLFRLSRVVLPASGDAAADAARAADLARSGWDAVAAAGPVDQTALRADEIAAGVVSPDLAASLSAAAVGAVLGPESSQGRWVLYRLDAREVDRAAAFSHYEDRIRGVLYEERLDALLARARSAQDVRLP